MDIAAQLTDWAPPTLVAGVFVLLLRHYAGQFLKRFESLESEVKHFRAEVSNRVTVADHRESVSELHRKINSMREDLVELRTEVRISRGSKRTR